MHLIPGVESLGLRVCSTEFLSYAGMMVYITMVQSTNQISKESLTNPNPLINDEIPDTAKHVERDLSGAVHVDIYFRM